jgi:large subunit ribosomal protein L11
MWVQVPPPSIFNIYLSDPLLGGMQFFIQNKNIFRELLTVLPAGAATTGPPLGPLLGQFGVNTASFCKQFNDATSIFTLTIKGKLILLTVKIIIYDDKSMGFVIYKPHTTFLIKQLRKPFIIGETNFYTITLTNLLKVVQFKFNPPNNSIDLFRLCKVVFGTALSMKTLVVS